MQVRAILLAAAALMLAPLGARAADLVVWWEKGYHPAEDMAVQETVAAFEAKAAAKVDLSFHVQWEMPKQVQAALDARRPPDIAFGLWLAEYASRWASEGRLIELTPVVTSLPIGFDADGLKRWTMANARTGRRALYGLPIGRVGNQLYVWKSLLERAGLTLADIPKEWEPFWSFWCDRVQPAVRQATGRDDIWAVGLTMSAKPADTEDQFFQFRQAFGVNYVSHDGELLAAAPEVRRELIKALTSYTEVWRKGCTPPDATDWTDAGNNEAFLAQRVVMTPNVTLSIPNALRRERPDDYYKNTATIEWPLGPDGGHFPIVGEVLAAMVFASAPHPTEAENFLRFLVEEGWLAHYLDFAGDRLLPPMTALLDRPFWLDARDPHKIAAVIQMRSRPLVVDPSRIDPGLERVYTKRVWAEAVHSVATEGISPERAVDEAIARVKQLLSE
jgi:multiple sugar transport system substrate-binding protein